MTPAHKAAMKIFIRDDFSCSYCGQRFSEESPPLHKHHRVFVSQGGKDDEDNLATCCWKCHDNHGALKNRRLRTEKDDSKMQELIERYKIRRVR